MATCGALPEPRVNEVVRLAEEFAAFCGRPGVGWIILERGDAPRAALERSHEFMRTNFLPGRGFASELDFQDQLDAWCEQANRRTHRIHAATSRRESTARAYARLVAAKLIVEELDYELEAGNQRTLVRIYRGHPFIVVPDVLTSLSRERVIVTEFVQGDGFAVLEAENDAERDRVGEIIFRFFYGSMFRQRKFSGDPHPGNLLRLPDGKLAFLDFGLFKEMEPEPIELELACQRAIAENDESELHRLLAANGFLPDPARVDPTELMAYCADGSWWYTRADHDVRLSSEVAAKAMLEAADPRSSHFRTMRHQDIKPEHLFGRRLEVLVLAVLGQLRASANWHRIAREWMYGEDPVTELGRQEAEFFAGPAVR